MKIKTIIIISAVVLTLTFSTIVVGSFFTKEDHEKRNGLSEVFTFSSTEKLAFVQYEDGKPMLFLSDESNELQELIDEESSLHEITHLAFSADGQKLLYIVNQKNYDTIENNASQIYEYNLQDYTSKLLFELDAGIITEAIYSPAGDNLYFLGAGTFTNYSPVASKKLHDFNIFKYEMDSGQLSPLTKLNSYSMNSLTLSHDQEKLYFIQDDDLNAHTAEDIFSSKQQIFEISISDPKNMRVLKTLDDDIYDLAISPDGKELMIQAVAGNNDRGTYIYELFSYNLETRKQTRVTFLNEYAGNPVYSNDGSTVYFIVDFNFASKKNDYAIYKLNRSSQQASKILRL